MKMMNGGRVDVVGRKMEEGGRVTRLEAELGEVGSSAAAPSGDWQAPTPHTSLPWNTLFSVIDRSSNRHYQRNRPSLSHTDAPYKSPKLSSIHPKTPSVAPKRSKYAGQIATCIQNSKTASFRSSSIPEKPPVQ